MLKSIALTLISALGCAMTQLAAAQEKSAISEQEAPAIGVDAFTG